MRGKGFYRSFWSFSDGITPAYAGKREIFMYEEEVVRDHPRLCGEKYLRRDAASMFMGSPPPMRGKVTWEYDASEMAGITPAYAGKSPADFLQCHARWDHPRLCGEKCTMVERKSLLVGSPPPMRGKGLDRNEE